MLKYMRTVSLACVSAALFLSATGTAAKPLQPGESLATGNAMQSENGRYIAYMQGDGNFVVYRNDGSGHAVWSTRTEGSGAVIATMQNDGNFVLYDGSGKAVWWTRSNGRDRTFAITEFGQAVVVAPGKPGRHLPGPGSEMFKRLRVKPVWLAPGFDAQHFRRPAGPHCVGDPTKCFPGRQIKWKGSP